MEKFTIPENNSPTGKLKNIYTYRDHSDEEKTDFVEIVAEDILQADKKYKNETGRDPKKQSDIGCSVESIHERQAKEFHKFFADVVEKEGLTWEEFAEREERWTYEDYLEKLNLTDEFLKDKKVLDIGAGMCLFASYCAKKGISNKVYSIESEDDSYLNKEVKKTIWSDQIRDTVEKKTFKALAQNLPFENESFELIVINAAMPGRDKECFGDLTMEEDVDKTYDEIVRTLVPGGEARLQPLNKDEGNEYFGAWATATRKKLAKISKEKNLNVTLEKMEDMENAYRIIIRKEK